MKLWHGYGSEHSMNLVMIGTFKSVSEAGKAKALIDRVIDQVRADENAGLITFGGQTDKFTDEMLQLLMESNLHVFGPAEMEQFAYDFNLDIRDNKIVINTDEVDISALLKFLLDRHARVEVYSAHHYPEKKD